MRVTKALLLSGETEREAIWSLLSVIRFEVTGIKIDLEQSDRFVGGSGHVDRVVRLCSGTSAGKRLREDDCLGRTPTEGFDAFRSCCYRNRSAVCGSDCEKPRGLIFRGCDSIMR